jgi:UDP-2,3-diacylglucosamine pyrophosphatase LpxH
MNPGTDVASERVVVVADAHVSAGSAAAFSEMLERIGRSGRRVVFLGDVFELWFAMPRYEDDGHRRFLDWCARQPQRPIFIEGNHEFFVARAYGGRVLETGGTTIPAPEWFRLGSVMLGHGDMLNLHDWKYRLFRGAIKNAVIRFLMLQLPGGPALADWIRRKTKHTNAEHRRYLLVEDLREAGRRQLAIPGIRRVLVGHFHQEHAGLAAEGITLMPDWLGTGQVGLLDPATGNIELRPWQEI